jgi:hypothetical protein
MPHPTKLDRLRDERTDTLASLKRAEEAHRAAVAALPETAALTAARLKHEAASVVYIREHERTQRRTQRRAEVRYEVREIDSYGDAFDCWVFPTKGEAIACARVFAKRLCEGHAVAVERVCDGEYATVWTGGSAAAIDAWENGTA